MGRNKRWDEEAICILTEKFPVYGSNIPEFVGKFTKGTIRRQACVLHIKSNKTLNAKEVRIVYNGVVYTSVREACANANISRSSVRSRILRYGEEAQKAFDHILVKSAKLRKRYACLPIVIDGYVCNDLDDVVEALGLSTPGAWCTYMSAHNAMLEEAIEYYLTR